MDANATVGDVGILNAPDEKGIHQRIAVLRHPQSSQSNYLAVLYQPEVLSITSQALLLKGTERDHTGAETVQEWWCRFD